MRPADEVARGLIGAEISSAVSSIAAASLETAEGLFMKEVAKVEDASRRELITSLVLKSAQQIVSDVMSKNIDKMNATIEENIRVAVRQAMDSHYSVNRIIVDEVKAYIAEAEKRVGSVSFMDALRDLKL